MPYEFFFSYARGNNDPYLRKFFDDLSDVVRQKRGLPQGAIVGFFDQEGLERGDEWDPTLVEAIQTSNVMIAVTSPAYVKSDYCGKELALFRERAAALVPAGQSLPPLIKPVIWVAIKLDVAPPQLGLRQMTEGDPNAVQHRIGLSHVLKQLREYEVLYNNLVETLAQQIVDDADAYQMPRLRQVPRLANVTSLWSVPRPTELPATGRNEVRFVIVAADPRQFGLARRPDPYQVIGGPDWKPFLGADSTRILPFVQTVAASAGLDFDSAELPFGPNLEAEIIRAWEKRQVVVLIVDGWTLYWDRSRGGTIYMGELQKLDGRLDRHWCVLAPWNDQDPDSVAKRREISDAMSAIFYGHSQIMRNPLFFRDAIKSPDELKVALREVLLGLREEIKKHAEVNMPVPVGPRRSIVSGPVGR